MHNKTSKCVQGCMNPQAGYKSGATASMGRCFKRSEYSALMVETKAELKRLNSELIFIGWIYHQNLPDLIEFIVTKKAAGLSLPGDFTDLPVNQQPPPEACRPSANQRLRSCCCSEETKDRRRLG
ncbi:hypothetical protein ACER0C_016114 [Sarotherodon galilaeus]